MWIFWFNIEGYTQNVNVNTNTNIVKRLLSWSRIINFGIRGSIFTSHIVGKKTQNIRVTSIFRLLKKVCQLKTKL